MPAPSTVIPDNVICHPELACPEQSRRVSGSSRLGRSRNEFGMTGLKGFTLIELLVVISIIAILSAVGFVSYQGVRGKALQAKTKADLDAITKAYETKYDPSVNNGQGGYPVLTPQDFASSKIPTPDGNGQSYFKSGPNVSNSPSSNYVLIGSVNSSVTCSAASGCNADCLCKASIQGVALDTTATLSYTDKITADINSMIVSVTQARIRDNKVFGQITSFCSDCISGCRSGADLSTDNTCLNNLKGFWSRITSSPLPIDPWGSPYPFDENEMEGGGCTPDGLRSVGSDRIWGTTDDFFYQVPYFVCE